MKLSRRLFFCAGLFFVSHSAWASNGAQRATALGMAARRGESVLVEVKEEGDDDGWGEFKFKQTTVSVEIIDLDTVMVCPDQPKKSAPAKEEMVVPQTEKKKKSGCLDSCIDACLVCWFGKKP